MAVCSPVVVVVVQLRLPIRRRLRKKRSPPATSLSFFSLQPHRQVPTIVKVSLCAKTMRFLK